MSRPHIHAHYFLRDGKKVVDEKKYTFTTLEYNSSVETITADIRDEFAFTEYSQSYAFYKDGSTEYIRFEGTLTESGFQLTADVFSCYCVSLNEDQDPPF